LLLIIYIMTLQPDLPRERFGLVRPAGRDAGTTALALAGALALTAPFLAVQVLVPAVRALGATGYRWGLRSPLELPLALAFGLAAGYREELFFRAYLLGRFEQAGISAAVGVAASTTLFALGHVYEGALGVAFAAVLGLFFALVFRRTRSLHACALAHGLLNTALLALGLLAPGLP
jgi:membrane protease YdiL (CAAX protease family)